MKYFEKTSATKPSKRLITATKEIASGKRKRPKEIQKAAIQWLKENGYNTKTI